MREKNHLGKKKSLILSACEVTRVVSLDTNNLKRKSSESGEKLCLLRLYSLLVIYIFFKRFYSPDIPSIYFIFALNRDCSIFMDWSNEATFFVPSGLSVAEDTFFP